MQNEKSQLRKYARFLAMISVSMLCMYLLMYAHSYHIIDHFWFSETRLFMNLIMGGAMIIIMLGFMLEMYPSRKVNALLFGLGILLMAGGIGLVRSQTAVDDRDYMEGMIPHHSIAILTSKRAQIEDVRVQKLAEKILRAQEKEIAEMTWLINDIEENGIVKSQAESERRPLPDFDQSPATVKPAGR